MEISKKAEGQICSLGRLEVEIIEVKKDKIVIHYEGAFSNDTLSYKEALKTFPGLHAYVVLKNQRRWKAKHTKEAYTPSYDEFLNENKIELTLSKNFQKTYKELQKKYKTLVIEPHEDWDNVYWIESTDYALDDIAVLYDENNGFSVENIDGKVIQQPTYDTNKIIKAIEKIK